MFIRVSATVKLYADELGSARLAGQFTDRSAEHKTNDHDVKAACPELEPKVGVTRCQHVIM
jgi:hypothetical protein